MKSYVYQVHPRTEESQEAQARYNARLYYKKWEPDEEE